MNEWEGHERRKAARISEQDIDDIAERAAAKALEKVYLEIGKAVVRKALFVLGASVLAVAAWLAGTGKLG